MKCFGMLMIATAWWAVARCAISRSADTISVETSQASRSSYEISCSPVPLRDTSTGLQRDSAGRDKPVFSTRSVDSDPKMHLGICSGRAMREKKFSRWGVKEDSDAFRHKSISLTLNAKSTFNMTAAKKPNFNGPRITAKAFRKLYAEISDEFQISTTTGSQNWRPVPVIFDDDTGAVFWTNKEDGIGILGQLFDMEWNKVESEFEVSTSTIESYNSQIEIALLASGSYVVCWKTSDAKIYARIFDKNISQGPEFQVNSLSHDADIPDILALDNGGFVIVWSYFISDQYDIYAQVFDHEGEKVGDEFSLITSTSEDEINPQIASLSNGNIILTWEGTGGPDSTDIFAEIFDNEWNSVVSEFVVNTYTTNSQHNPKVAAFQNGGFVIAWFSDGQDGSDKGTFTQVFDSSGNKNGSEIQINQRSQGNQYLGGVIVLNDDDFLTSFHDSSDYDGDGWGIFARRFDQSGNPTDSEFQVNQHSDDDQRYSGLAKIACGFIVTWTSQYPTASDWTILGRLYYDSIPSTAPSLINPVQDLDLNQFQNFLFVVPADTFYSPSGNQLAYSARILVDGEEVSYDSFWLSFDPSSRTFSGTPTLEQVLTVQLEASEASGGTCAYKTVDEFQITVAANSKPVVNSSIPNQPIPFSSEEIWEYYLPTNAFKDLQGDPIIFTGAVTVISGEEKDLNTVWETLDFDTSNGKLFGIPNLSGHFTIRIYADDGLGDLQPTPLDMTVEVISQGIELLELYQISQRGSKGFVSTDDSFFWVAESSELKRFDLSSDNPLLIIDPSLSHSLSSSITALARISQDRMATGDDQGNIALLSSSTGSLISQISVSEQVTDIYNEDEDFIYVSHASSLSIIQLGTETLEISRTISLPKPVTSITKTADIVYAGTQDGLLLIDTLTNTSDDSNIADVGHVIDLQIFETYLYVLGEYRLHVFDVSDPLAILLVNTRSLEGLGASLVVSKIDNDVIVFISEGENGVSLINASNPLNLSSEGYYSYTSSVNWFCVSSAGTWGVIMKESEVLTVEIFRRNIQLEVCDTNSNPCSQELEIQAQTDFSKDFIISEFLPTYKTDFIYSLSYSYTVLQVSGSVYSSAPDWLFTSTVENKLFRISGQAPERLIGSVVDLEVQAFAFDSDGEKLLTLRKVVSLSIVPKHASVGSSIPDQSLQVGEEWVFSFDQSVFPDADDLECEYLIESEWIKSYDISFIRFTPSSRQWHISYLDSTKENFFGCDPCDSTEYSTTYQIKVTAKNSASDSDPGVSTTFNLYIYSGKIPDQQTHPGISQTIVLDESIFPSGIEYTVSLLDSDGESQDLPWWMSYISNERKILMFPSISEIDQDFDIQISGNNNGVELTSQFAIQVRNEAPVAIKQLQNQRVKLGESLDYSFASDTFSDSDGDSLSYTVQWHKEDGTLTTAIPSWISFSESTLTFYGSPSVQGSYTLLVSADDGLGGQASMEFVVEAYNNSPLPNPDSSFPTQIDHHIGLLFSLTLPSNLFTDADGDTLSYSALQSDGSDLPSWLSFNPSTLFFSGTPSASNLIGTSLNIRVSANDGYSDTHTDLSLSITNTSPSVSNSLNSQINYSLGLGFIKFKPGVPFEYSLSRDTFTDNDNDALVLSSRLSNGDPLPQWLNFDSFNQQFFGTPPQAETVSVSVTASDGYASASDTFEMNIINQLPTVNKPLQGQVDSLYPDPLVEGFYFSFQFSEDTFIDEDDSLSYSALFSENGGEWKSLDSVWVELEGRTLSGIVSTASTSNSTHSLQITASDGQQNVSDTLSLTILAPFPSPSASTIHIESIEDSIEVEVFTNGPKIAVFSYGTLSILDTSNNNKTHWRIEGSPSDVNYVLERVKYRPSPNRLLSESKVFLRMNGLEQEYPLSVFTLQEPIQSSSIPDQKAYIDDLFSMGIKKYFNYADESELTYSFIIEQNPEGYTDWLSLEGSSLSGIPTYEGETGSYKLRVTATDEFDESKSENIDLEADYTLIQKLITLIVLIIEISGPILTLLGLIVYRAAIWNLFTKHRKLYSPFQLRKTQEITQELLILRPDEEKVALKIFKRLQCKTSFDHDVLIPDIASAIQEMDFKKPEKDPKVNDFEIEASKNPPSNGFEESLEFEDAPIVKIKKAEYHSRFLFFCVKDRIFKQVLSKSQQKELNRLVASFKEQMLNLSAKKEMPQFYSMKASEWKKCKDLWTIQLPDLTKSLTSTSEMITDFFSNLETNIEIEIFVNRIRIEQWKDRAVRIDHKSSLKEWELYQKSTLCCKLPWKKHIENWVDGDSFSIRICRKNELVMKFNVSENPISERLYMRLFDRTGYLICSMVILPAPDLSDTHELERSSILKTRGHSTQDLNIIAK